MNKAVLGIFGFNPLGVVYILEKPLAALLSTLYGFFGNYGVAIIMLTFILRILLIPLNISTQKSSLKMQALTSKMNELKRQCGDDKKLYEQEAMKLQSESGAGMGCGGCLGPLLQLFILVPIYRIVSAPLQYLAFVSKDNIMEMAKIADISSKKMAYVDIPLMEKLLTDHSFFVECVNKGFIKASQLVPLDFLGLDLIKTPTLSLKKLTNEPSVYVPLLLIPILVLVLNFISIKLMTVLKPGYKEEKETKERMKKNPARQATTASNDSMESAMKATMWFTPFIMIITTFASPAALGLYWLMGAMMVIVSQLVVYYLFTKPYELKKLELKELQANVFKKEKSDEGKTRKNKKKKK